jgi:hypothetical protein
MTDFNDWYAQEFPDLLTSVDDFRAELQRAYEAGFASQSRTLRDEFAGQSLAGDMANSDEGVFRNDVDGKYLLDRAMFHYRMADAMLEARKTTGEDNK